MSYNFDTKYRGIKIYNKLDNDIKDIIDDWLRYYEIKEKKLTNIIKNIEYPLNIITIYAKSNVVHHIFLSTYTECLYLYILHHRLFKIYTIHNKRLYYHLVFFFSFVLRGVDIIYFLLYTQKEYQKEYFIDL